MKYFQHCGHNQCEMWSVNDIVLLQIAQENISNGTEEKPFSRTMTFFNANFPNRSHTMNIK